MKQTEEKKGKEIRRKEERREKRGKEVWGGGGKRRGRRKREGRQARIYVFTFTISLIKNMFYLCRCGNEF